METQCFRCQGKITPLLFLYKDNTGYPFSLSFATELLFAFISNIFATNENAPAVFWRLKEQEKDFVISFK